MSYHKAFINMTEKIRELDGVIAILLLGKIASVSEQDFDKLNDIDLLVVYDKNIGYERQVELIDGIPFDISYISIFDLITQIESKSTLWINMIVSSKIYSSKNELIFGIIDRVKDIYFAGTVKLKNGDIDLIRFNITQNIITIKNRKDDKVLLKYLLNKLFDTLVEDYYRMNAIWYPSSKYLFDDLEKIDTKLSDLSKKFISLCDEKEKMDVLDEIVDYVLKPFGGFLKTWAKGPYEITL